MSPGTSVAAGPHDVRTCLVAVDGTDASVDALVWGLRHAAEHDMDVEVLTVWPPQHAPLVHEVPGHFCAPRWSARAAQAEAVRRAVDTVPDAPRVETTLENADAAAAIVRASAHHDLVVLGAGAPGGRHRLIDRVLADAACDVVVVDPDRVVGPDVERGPREGL